MGQAKIRGSFEDRKTQAITKKKADELKRQEELTRWWNSLTEEQRKGEINKQKIDQEVIGNVYSMLNVLEPYIKINKRFNII